MKVVPLILLLLALSSAVLLAQQPGQLSMQKGRQVLFDFRKEKAARSAKITPATQRMVLSKVFRKYLTDDKKCSDNFEQSGDDYLASARKTGQIVPMVADFETGSFTAPGQTETAYVIWTGECGASHAQNYGSKRVAIFSGQQLVADVDADFNGHLNRKSDLNSDGVDELLMSASDMAQGTMMEIASLVEFRSGRRRVIEDFGSVVEDNCASGFPGSSAKASVLTISDLVPGRMPKLRIDNYVSSCREVKRWRFLSTGKIQ
jgi:hypothetical protein